MDLISLDREFRPLAGVRYINLQWNRRYYQAGQFSVRILADEYDPRMQYLYTAERPELAYIEKVELTREMKGDFVQLSGRFFECVLSRLYAFPYIKGNFTLKALGQRFLEHEWYKIPNYNITVAQSVPTDISVDVEWKNEPLGDCAYTTLETLEMSQKLRFDPLANAFTWEVWQGLDRTQEQSQNAFAMFSDESYHVTNYSYTRDESGWRNHCMVLYGRDSAGDPYRYDQWPDNEQQDGRRTVVLNLSDDAQQDARRQKAAEELVKYPIAHAATFDVVQDGLLYLTDYDLGDKCDVVCHRLGVRFSARITEIDEVWKNGQHTVKVRIGKTALTAYERVKRAARSDVRAYALPTTAN